jgi:NADH-quinone oxidoreductase subunit G
MRSELAQLSATSGVRANVPDVATDAVSGVTLSTWNQLLDSGTLQAGEPFLAATARDPYIRMSQNTALEYGLHEGESATVSTARGSVTLPVHIVDAVDNSVWLPTNSPESHVRVALGAAHGAGVTITKGGAQ